MREGVREGGGRRGREGQGGREERKPGHRSPTNQSSMQKLHH